MAAAAIITVTLGSEATGVGAETRSAPRFETITFSGESFSTDSLKGRPALLIFWAPWCKVCQRELPLLAEFSKEGKSKSLRILSIGFADVRENVEAFVKARPETFVFPTAYDEDRWVAHAFKITATPTSVVLDAQGHIALVHRGGGLLQNLEFREFLASLTKD